MYSRSFARATRCRAFTVVRLNPKTGETTEYKLPHETNIRRVFVDNSAKPIAFWTGNNHHPSIVKVEPLD